MTYNLKDYFLEKPDEVSNAGQPYWKWWLFIIFCVLFLVLVPPLPKFVDRALILAIPLGICFEFVMKKFRHELQNFFKNKRTKLRKKSL